MSEVVLTFDMVGAWAGPRRLFAGFTADMRTRDLVILAGPSGSGKSTLLQRLALLPDNPGRRYHGSIRLERKGVDEGDQTSTHQGLTVRMANSVRVGLVFQDGAFFDELNVSANLQFGADHRPAAQNGSADQQQIATLARELAEWTKETQIPLSQRIRNLSGGQKRKVALKRTNFYKPDVILFDEPTAGLDPKSAAQVAADIREVAESALVIVVTHELAYFKTSALAGSDVRQRVFVLDSKDGSIEERTTDTDECLLDRVSRLETPAGHSQQTTWSTLAILVWPIESEPWLRLFQALVMPLVLGTLRLLRGMAAVPAARMSWLWSFGVRVMRRAWLSPQAIGYFMLMGFLLGFTGAYFLHRDFPQRAFAWPVVSDRVVAGFTSISYRSIIPLFVSILFAARSGAALAADLGNRTLTQQVAAMRSFGASENTYLVLPVFVAFVSGLLVLQLVTFAASWAGSACAYLSAEEHPLEFGWVAQSMRDLGTWQSLCLPWQQPWTWSKLTLTALLIAGYTCHHGLRDKPDSQSVSAHAIEAVLWSTILVVVVTFLFTFWEFQ